MTHFASPGVPLDAPMPHHRPMVNRRVAVLNVKNMLKLITFENIHLKYIPRLPLFRFLNAPLVSTQESVEDVANSSLYIPEFLATGDRLSRL